MIIDPNALSTNVLEDVYTQEQQQQFKQVLREAPEGKSIITKIKTMNAGELLALKYLKYGNEGESREWVDRYLEHVNFAKSFYSEMGKQPEIANALSKGLSNFNEVLKIISSTVNDNQNISPALMDMVAAQSEHDYRHAVAPNDEVIRSYQELFPFDLGVFQELAVKSGIEATIDLNIPRYQKIIRGYAEATKDPKVQSVEYDLPNPKAFKQVLDAGFNYVIKGSPVDKEELSTQLTELANAANPVTTPKHYAIGRLLAIERELDGYVDGVYDWTNPQPNSVKYGVDLVRNIEGKEREIMTVIQTDLEGKVPTTLYKDMLSSISAIYAKTLPFVNQNMANDLEKKADGINKYTAQL